ncbi:MAG TPA: UDP-N-acetylmuramate dehydrogenase [Flavobacteriales bacterium]|jgi:UDP-N-acetylmuramate dehydrogenase|nr:UDP-N-acetylmuramate dehydrogenase [Flavobacteriales bacterium]
MDIHRDVDLQPYNTFHVRARAAWFAPFTTVDELRHALNDERLQGLPRLVLGGGSNMLFTRDWPGVVLRNEVPGIEVLGDDGEHVVVRAGAGVVWHELVMHCVAQGWGGVENLSLIPGRVGAGPMQNIGAYGVEIKDRFDHLEALRISDGEVVRFSAADCRFGYRESFFKREGKDRFVILHVAFRLKKNLPTGQAGAAVHVAYGSIQHELAKYHVTAPTIKDVSDAVIRIRSSKLPDPAQVGNAGSFFKNPVVDAAAAEAIKRSIPDLVTYPAPEGQLKLAAGQLIEKAGWKGYRQDLPEGGYGVHKDQALVLVNYGGATGDAIYGLSTQVLEDVRLKYGVELEREVNII